MLVIVTAVYKDCVNDDPLKMMVMLILASMLQELVVAVMVVMTMMAPYARESVEINKQFGSVWPQ